MQGTAFNLILFCLLFLPSLPAAVVILHRNRQPRRLRQARRQRQHRQPRLQQLPHRYFNQLGHHRQRPQQLRHRVQPQIWQRDIIKL